MKSAHKFFVSLLACLLFMPPWSFADSVDGDRVSFSLGVFATDRDSKGSLDSSSGIEGTDVDFEADLGLETSDTVFRFDGYYQFNERHRVDLSVFDLSRNSKRVIERDFRWGDSSYAVDAEVRTGTDLAIYKAAYTYSFLRRNTGYLGVTAGLYVADISVSLGGQTFQEAEVGEITAPMPVVGLRGEYQVAKSWTLRGSSEIFVVNLDDIQGSLVDVFIGLDYRLLDTVSLGVGYNAVEIDVDATDSDYSGNLQWDYKGGLIYLKFNY